MLPTTKDDANSRGTSKRTAPTNPPALSAFDPASLAIIERLERLEREFTRFTNSSIPRESCYQQPFPAGRLPHISYQNLDQILKWPVFQHARLSVSPHAQSCSSPSEVFCGGAEGFGRAVGNVLDGVPIFDLVHRFFTHVHSRNPILDEGKIRTLAQEIQGRGIGWDTKSALILLVLANGALGHPLPTPAHPEKVFGQDQATALFLAAEQRLGYAVASTGIMQAQCLFLAGVFLMSSLRPFDAWRMFLQALAMCRTFKRTLAYDAADTLAAESVSCSAWKSERELCRELWASADCASFSHEHLHQFPNLPTDCEGENLYIWYFYLSEISAWRLGTRVEEEMTGFAVEGGGSLVDLTEIADSLMDQAVQWQNSLALKVSTSHDENESDMLRLILRARIAYVQDMISWPFVYALIHDGAEPESPKVCEWAAKGLSCHLHKLLMHRIQFYHRHHGTWLMIRSCARSASILLAAARRPFAQRLLPAQWRGPVEATLKMLQFWQPYVKELQEAVECIQALYSQL
ncbi:uncharacterized protein A1O5_01557 [Cladophialophora psammophila CBS 110553]|uniref:Transcription factor domain-containing protein n=1 Tax=Cladophialophora psammophila CBS 110553 TaxID=1182543 RepID=W9XD42_9EURO|nr:uncharacterized protein A1O5_01557 [Cladophialophora psammophila CBS 110553]EXJ74861.1 hypothetical protein A1O5_01557 [Cladophialophora psammophila CBS 110553]